MSDPFVCPACGPPAAAPVPFVLPKLHGGTVSGLQCPTCEYRVVTARAKGFVCPECKGVRLHVMKRKNVAPGVCVRYRHCPACGHKSITEERVSSTRRPRGAAVG